MAYWKTEIKVNNPDLAPEVIELIPDYLSRRVSEVGILRDLMKKSDYGSIQRIGHKLKGNGYGYGFKRLSQLGKEIETAAHFQRDSELEDLIYSLEKELLKLTQE